jgi:hypothetical protein
MNKRNWLIAGGISSIAVAVLHIGAIFVGAPAYRYFGAGEEMAQMSEAGSPIPALVTFAIVVVFFTWGLYAFSALGWIRRLPLLRLGLIVISAVYTLRGLGLIPQLIWKLRYPVSIASQGIVFSLVSLLIGVFYIIGTWKNWSLTAR